MTTFELDQSRETTAVVRPVGRLNMAAAPKLASTVVDIIRAGQSTIIMDLSATDFIDSSGLGALIASLKRCRQAGGDLRLAAPCEQVVTALQLTNLNRVLVLDDTVDDAFARI